MTEKLESFNVVDANGAKIFLFSKVLWKVMKKKNEN